MTLTMPPRRKSLTVDTRSEALTLPLRYMDFTFDSPSSFAFLLLEGGGFILLETGTDIILREAL
jgi:hypothetical protein